MRLIYNAPSHHKLLLEGPDGPTVFGGETFTATEEEAEEHLTSPHYDVQEAPEDLESLTRPELNRLAEQAGVENPGALSNKSAVIAELENSEPEAAGAGPTNEPQED